MCVFVCLDGMDVRYANSGFQMGFHSEISGLVAPKLWYFSIIIEFRGWDDSRSHPW